MLQTGIRVLVMQAVPPQTPDVLVMPREFWPRVCIRVSSWVSSSWSVMGGENSSGLMVILIIADGFYCSGRAGFEGQSGLGEIRRD
jgi:hypothetical protein